MPVQIKIDQAGQPAGVAGQAREDLATGTGVTLTALGGPFLAYQWRIISKPIDILIPSRSSALLATPASPVTLLTPIDVKGEHLIELVVDSGNGLGASDLDIVRIGFYAGPSLATDPRQLPQREPAAFEALEHNAPDTLDPAGNPDGWARTMKKWFAIIVDMFSTKGWASARITCPAGGPAAIVRGFNVASATRLSTGRIAVLFTTPMPDANYSVTTGIMADLSSSSPVGSVTVLFVTANGFTLSTFDAFNSLLADGYDVGFRVELGV